MDYVRDRGGERSRVVVRVLHRPPTHTLTTEIKKRKKTKPTRDVRAALFIWPRFKVRLPAVKNENTTHAKAKWKMNERTSTRELLCIDSATVLLTPRSRPRKKEERNRRSTSPTVLCAKAALDASKAVSGRRELTKSP